jgi:hypothetical protein
MSDQPICPICRGTGFTEVSGFTEACKHISDQPTLAEQLLFGYEGGVHMPASEVLIGLVERAMRLAIEATHEIYHEACALGPNYPAIAARMVELLKAETKR